MNQNSSGKCLRVLAADDSAVMRSALRMLFQLHGEDTGSSLPPMTLCGLAKDGVEALDLVGSLQPDVLLLDLEMPRLNGLGVLRQLRAQGSSLPVIMCSAYTEKGARSTLDALADGAQDYVMKPGQQRDFASALDALTEQLLPRIAALAAQGESVVRPVPRQAPCMEAGQARVEAVVIAVSTGGPSALETLLPALPATFPVPLLIVQHMPKLFTGALAQRLNGLCRMPVAQAAEGAAVTPGRVWVAPGDAHMEVACLRAGTRIRLHQGPALNSCTPSADYLFRSAAQVFGAGALAVVMTGMGQDGMEGARAIRQAGGAVLAQDQASSAVWGMPGRVVQAGLASATVPLRELASVLVERATRGMAAGTYRAVQEAQHAML